MTKSERAILTTPGAPMFDAERYRQDFPIFNQRINGHPLIYLDTAASAQKPKQVIDAMTAFLQQDYANIHRGVHELSVRATDRYEGVRETIRKFINAAGEDEIVFTRNGTEAINLVASSWGRANLKAGDEIVITALEHHANIVPWQLLGDAIGTKLVIVPISEEGEVSLDAVRQAITPQTRLVSVAHVSNALGTILPVEEIIRLAHAAGALALIDGCQAVSHMEVDVQSLDADFYVFSGHKLYGPTGIGVLYGKREILRAMPPYQGGGDMISSVSFEKTTYKEPPHRFEAGTPAITEVIGLGAAIDYVSAIGMTAIGAHEDQLLFYATDKLRSINSLKIIGTAKRKAGVLSFVMETAHPHDIGTILDRRGVAVRAGHHCAQPIMDWLKIPGTARASFGIYNTQTDVDALVEALREVQKLFG